MIVNPSQRELERVLTSILSAVLASSLLAFAHALPHASVLAVTSPFALYPEAVAREALQVFSPITTTTTRMARRCHSLGRALRETAHEDVCRIRVHKGGVINVLFETTQPIGGDERRHISWASPSRPTYIDAQDTQDVDLRKSAETDTVVDQVSRERYLSDSQLHHRIASKLGAAETVVPTPRHAYASAEYGVHEYSPETRPHSASITGRIHHSPHDM